MGLEKRAKELAMSESVVAQKLAFEVADARPGERNLAIINRTYAVLKRYFPGEWTWRRVRSLVEKDVSDTAVRFREIRQMVEAIERQKADAAALEAARRDHAEFITETKRLATLYAVTDEAFYSQEIERLRALGGDVGADNLSRARTLDRSRTEGEG